MKAFRDVKNLVENQSGDSIKIVRSDWGREFENHKFTEYLATCGIAHKYSAPYSHKQNRQSERLNRTILDKARCLLFQAQMSKEYWSEAVLAAAHLYNRIPHSAIDYSTPYQARFGKQPNIADIRIFGSLVYSKTPNIKKLDEKSKKGCLVGFRSNQFKILDISRNKTYWSRDVTVLEGRFPRTSEDTPTDHSSAIDILNISSLDVSSVQSAPEVSTTPNLPSLEDLSEEDSQPQASETEARPNRVIQTRART